MLRATGLGPEWQVIRTGCNALRDLEHLCGGLHGPGEAHVSEYVRLRYETTGTPGIEAARCERCREAWVRAGKG